MRVPLLFSVAFHLAIFLLAIFGLPSRDADVMEDYRVIDVDVVSVTQTPEPQQIPKEKQTARPVPPPPPPKPTPPPPPAPPEKTAALEPEPKPEPAPEAVPVPTPKPKPAEAKPKPKPIEEPPKAKEDPKKKVVKAPRPKPRPKPDFNAMMLKTVQKLEETPPPTPKDKAKEKEQEKSFDDKMAALMKRSEIVPREPAQRAPLGESLSISEIDAIRRQVEQCWLVPAAIGAKDVEKMTVEIGMTLNPDGSLRAARIIDQFRFETNATYKAVAESALRAVRNPRCSKFNLPLEKYDIWKDIVMTFRPNEMVGR